MPDFPHGGKMRNRNLDCPLLSFFTVPSPPFPYGRGDSRREEEGKEQENLAMRS